MIQLHLGCGNTHRAGWVNIDSRALPGVDVVRDVLRGLPYSDDTVDEIYSENFLEHIPQAEVIWLVNEMWRVLKPGGLAHHLIPEAGTVFDYQDPTHVSRFCAETFTYFNISHGRQKYYDHIKPWIITLRYTDPNRLLDVDMRKP